MNFSFLCPVVDVDRCFRKYNTFPNTVSQTVSLKSNKYTQFWVCRKRKPLPRRCERGFCFILFDFCALNETFLEPSVSRRLGKNMGVEALDS